MTTLPCFVGDSDPLLVRVPGAALPPDGKTADLDAGPLYPAVPAQSVAAVLRAEGDGTDRLLEKHQMFALTRYSAVVKALRDWEAFPSSFGVMMNDDMNQVLRDSRHLRR
jgi:hypothetical protein